MNTTVNIVRTVEAAPGGLHIEPHIYEALAQKLLEEIGWRNYISTTLEVEDGDRFFRFVCAAVIYRRDEQWPEGVFEVISDIVPVWWELHSFQDGEEVLNDATFNELKRYLIE